MNHSTTQLSPTEATKQGFSIDRHVYPNIGYKGARFNPRQTVEVYTELEAKLLNMDQALLPRYSIAAFMSAGMHTNVEQLDQAKDAAGTGCVELVMAVMGYVDYAEALFKAGGTVRDGVPGVMEYEICEPFGEWFITTMLCGCTVDGSCSLPDHEQACFKLRELTYEFYEKNDRTPDPLMMARLEVAMTAVPLPDAPQL
jgi:hypothetical protein